MSRRPLLHITLLGLTTALLLTSAARASELAPRDDLAPMGCFLAAGLQAPGVATHISSARSLHGQLDVFTPDSTGDTVARTATAAHITMAAFYGTQSALWVVRGGMLIGQDPTRRSTLMLSAGLLDTAMGAGSAVVGAVILASRHSMDIGGTPGELLLTSGTVHLMFGIGSLVAGIVELITGAVMRDDEDWNRSRTAWRVEPGLGGVVLSYRW